MRITIETIENLQESLKSLPVVEDKKREVGKPEAVKLLAAEVAKLQEKGYTIEMIAKILTTHGLEIKPSTLKSYLTRARGQKTAKKRVPKPTPKAADIPRTGGDRKASSDATLGQKNSKSVTSKAGNIDTVLGAAQGMIRTDEKLNTDEPVKSGTFKPRDDSREI